MNFRGIHGKAAGSQSSGHYLKPLSEGNFNTFWFFGRLRFGKQADAQLKIARASFFLLQTRLTHLKENLMKSLHSSKSIELPVMIPINQSLPAFYCITE